eukprot:1159281-Pelagomonas_calceolata.AAC.8
MYAPTQMPSEAEHALMAEDCAPESHHASMAMPALKHTCSSIGPSRGSANARSDSHDQPPLLPSLPLKEQLQRVRRMQQYFTSFEALVCVQASAKRRKKEQEMRRQAVMPSAIAFVSVSLSSLALPVFSICNSAMHGTSTLDTYPGA